MVTRAGAALILSSAGGARSQPVVTEKRMF